MTPHAIRQCQGRSLPVEAVQVIVGDKLRATSVSGDVAVFVGRVKGHDSIVASNGEQVWAIVRGGVVATVMCRRDGQPNTRGALHVDAVIGEQHRKVGRAA
jgi:hypothetical protein